MHYQDPLVSIVVITYNSSKFVLETLESAKEQSWQNVELIITDDCSTDNTVEICQNWMDKNKTRFVNAKLVTAERNTGIAPNANRGMKASKGEWVKFIAGDDLLLPNCIEELIHYLKMNKNLPIKFLVHGILPFKNGTQFKVVFPPDEFIENDAHHQLIYLLKRGNCISGSAFFLERLKLIELGGFDESYVMFEDFPLTLKYTRNNYKIWIIKKPLFKYRIHDCNLSFDRSNLLQESYIRFRNEILFPILFEQGLFLTYWHRFVQGKQKYRFLWAILFRLSPLSWLDKIYRITGKSYFYNHKFEFQKTTSKNVNQ